jgi:Tol biopolymer transport system component
MRAEMRHCRKILVNLFLCGLVLLIASQCTKVSSVDNSLSNSTPTPIQKSYGLIYYSERDNANNFENRGFGGLYLTNLATREERSLTNDSAVAQAYGFSWSPITQKLIFSGRGKNGTNDSYLYTIDLNGNLARLTSDDTSENRGRWSPDGHKILFWSARPDNRFLYLMNTDSSKVEPVFEKDLDFLLGKEFVWAPSSSRLAVSIIPYDNTSPVNLDAPLTNIMIADLEPKKTLFTLPGNRIRTDFSWSYNSNKLVYLSNPIDFNSFVRVSTAMYVFDIQREEESMIAGFKVIGTPIWSPVEDVIAFSAAKPEEKDDLNVYLINGDGTHLKRLTNGGAYRVASWSPDGSKLAVEIIGAQLTDHEIGVIDIKTGTLERITHNNVFDAFPVWVEL